MYAFSVVLALVLLANAGAFSVMKSSSIVSRKTLSMSMNNIPVDLITGIIIINMNININMNIIYINK